MGLKVKILLVLLVAVYSCRKSNYVPPVYPLPPDSLINWTVAGSIPGIFVGDIWFTSASRGFAVGDKMYQTMDGGESWSAIPNTPVMYNFFNLFFVNSQTGFAQGLTQLATTMDGGNSWSVKTLPTDSAQTIFFVSPTEGFYGDQGAAPGLKKTINAGNNWVTSFKDSITAIGYYPYFLNSDTGFVATGSGTFAFTFDGGQIWQSRIGVLPANPYFPSDPNYASFNQLFFLDANKGFYACPDGIMETLNGGNSWQNILTDSIDGNYLNTVNVVRFVDTNTGYYKGLQAIYKTLDGGQTWSLNCRVGADELIGMYFLDIHNGWASTSKGRILKLQQ
jgi:photosystem II stability/assembly factor-like uncharacterized protein